MSTSTFLLKIFRCFGKTREPRYEKDGSPLEHWNMLRDSHERVSNTEDNNKHENKEESTAAVWKSVDPGFYENHLSKKEYRVLRCQGTEPPRSSAYDKFYPSSTGHFACRACGLPLYAVASKFDSGTGWPSFGEHVAGNITTKTDYAHGMRRTELVCRRCHSHLGHVFAEKNSQRVHRFRHYTERQCVNGISIYYIKTSLPEGTDTHATTL